jgi:nitrogen fixation/metabolism regulation signal transduction histidine kinase
VNFRWPWRVDALRHGWRRIKPIETRTVRGGLLVSLAVLTAMALILLFLLAQATNNQDLYERNYTRLLTLNAVVAGILLLVIASVMWRLWRNFKRGRFGSRLLLRLIFVFALVGVLPGLLVYAVSYQFVSRSIEGWFNEKVEAALEAGLNLGRNSLDSMAADLSDTTQQSAQQLQGLSDLSAALLLDRIKETTNAKEASIWTASGQMLASVGSGRIGLLPEKPSSNWLKQLRNKRAVTQIEGFDELGGGASTTGGANVGTNLAPNSGATTGVAAPQAKIRAWALIPNSGYLVSPDVRYLQLIVSIPSSLVRNAIALQEANREYQERAFARRGLQRMYFGSLTLTLFLGVFGAFVLVGVLGNQLARPLVLLAEGVQQVAKGDLSPKVTLNSADELAGLTRSFASMTQQLFDSRRHVQHSMDQLFAAREHLQTILDNLSSGVLVLDASGRILSCNPAATRVLRQPLAAWTGHDLRDVPGLSALGQTAQHQFEQFIFERESSAIHAIDHWQTSLDVVQERKPALNLLLRGAELPNAQRLLVFDDVSELVSAQRAQAWTEVAQRLAHEIKNPLTPIQLAAERLEMKLAPKLQVLEERGLLVKSVKTIVDQVDAMKRLVNEFRDYGRLPKADLQPLDLNALIFEVLQLYPADERNVRPKCELQAACPLVLADAQQLRQVLHNLVQNAQDACTDKCNPEVWVRTQLIDPSMANAQPQVRLSVSDNGVGFAEEILKRAFEPYVTTKDKGTGLGLAVVKKIASDHGARLSVRNLLDGDVILGARVSLSLRLAI